MCTVNMKHCARSQEIRAISQPFGEENHTQWDISGIHIVRLQMVIVCSAFSEGHGESYMGEIRDK